MRKQSQRRSDAALILRATLLGNQTRAVTSPKEEMSWVGRRMSNRFSAANISMREGKLQEAAVSPGSTDSCCSPQPEEG